MFISKDIIQNGECLVAVDGRNTGDLQKKAFVRFFYSNVKKWIKFKLRINVLTIQY